MDEAVTARGMVCAHRGASAHHPDNSLPAFIEAIASGCEVIETDVRLRASDSTLVLAHDEWQVDEPEVCTLADLTDLASGRVGLDLEIVELGLERPLLDIVDGFPGWLIVTSTLPAVLTEVSRLADHIDTGLVIEAPYDGSVFDGDPYELSEKCGAYVTLVEDELATPAVLAQGRDVGRPLWVWTVNDVARISELLAEPSVTGVITDDPALAVRLRDEAPSRVPWP
jgi:glycerophosphoryl diester phosphodiesterase